MAFPGSYNFNYYRGDTKQIVIRPKTANGESFALLDYNAAFTIATARGASATQYVASAVVDDVNDLVTCTILDSVGRSLQPGSYVYDVQIENGIEVYTILTGNITVTDDITGAI
jgi:hypothetical protein